MTTVKVYDWISTDGQSLGCGTECELRYWQAEGIINPDARLGKCIGREPASEDERRKVMWGLAGCHDQVPASPSQGTRP